MKPAEVVSAYDLEVTMSYRIKFQTEKGGFFHMSFTAQDQATATSMAQSMFPKFEIVDVAPGRCSARPTFVR